MPKPGKRLRNMVRLAKTGCFRQASLLAQGSLKSGRLDIPVKMIEAIYGDIQLCLTDELA